MTLSAFDEYYGGRPANRGLVFRTVPDETMRGLELRKGSVDLVVNDLSPDVAAGLENDGHLHVVTAPGTDYAYLGFNLRDPALRDVRVRRAIGYAIDQQGDRARTCGAVSHGPATGIVPPMSWAYEADVFRFTYDPAKARALLDEAGLVDPDGDGPAPRLRLTLKTSTDERYRLQAAVIQENLRAVGIALDVRSSEFATLMADVIKGNVQLYTLQFVGITDPDMLRRAFHSTQTPPDGFNRGHYRNADLDRLIDARVVGARRRHAPSLLSASPARDRGRRAVRESVVQDERRGGAALARRRDALPHCGLHVPAQRLTPGHALE